MIDVGSLASRPKDISFGMVIVTNPDVISINTGVGFRLLVNCHIKEASGSE